MAQIKVGEVNYHEKTGRWSPEFIKAGEKSMGFKMHVTNSATLSRDFFSSL